MRGWVRPVLPEFGIALLNPGTEVATAEVFRTRNGPFLAPAQLPSAWPDAATMAAIWPRSRMIWRPPPSRFLQRSARCYARSGLRPIACSRA